MGGRIAGTHALMCHCCLPCLVADHETAAAEAVRKADILAAAVGRPQLIRGEDVKPGAVVVDVGYNAGNVGDVEALGGEHGDREANAAFYQIVLSQLRWEDRSREYLRRRLAEGQSRREIIRSLKRYVAREIYRSSL